MAIALDIIRRALRICKVTAGGESVQPEDAQDAFDTLNAMLAEWHEAGIGLPDYSLATYQTELASGAADREAIAYQLALRVCGEYGVDLMPSDLALAEDTMRRLRLRYFQPGQVDAALPSEQAQYNIEAG